MGSSEQVRAAMIETLGTGAMSRHELLAAVTADDRLGSASVVAGRMASILQLDTSFAHPGDRVCFVPGLADGMSWTVRVDAADAAQGFVRLHPALSAIGWWLVGEGADLVDSAGAVIGRVTTDGIWLDDRDTDIVVGPAGWLDGFEGGWASVTVRSSTLRIERVAVPPRPTTRQVAALRVGFATAVRSSEAILFDGERKELAYTSGVGPMHEAILLDREAFTDELVPHLPDLYSAAGLEERNHVIAETGFDWDALRERQRRNRMAAFYALDERQIDALTLLSGASELYVSSGEESLGETDLERDGAAILLSALLEDGDVADAFWTETQERGVGLDEFGEFVEALTQRMSDVELAGLAWLRSRCREEAGDVHAAVELLGLVTGPRCEHWPALFDAAAYASDRGDAVMALRLLRQAGFDGVGPNNDRDPEEAVSLLREVAGFALRPPRPTAGRNDRCPCGSGRKYKACHLGRERHDLPDRASWLYDKARRFVRRHDELLLADVADEITADAPQLRHEMRTGPFVADLVLHEHGLMREFLDERGWLLPDDEALLAAQWLLVDRSVFEIVDIGDEEFRLRDIGRGEIITIVNASPSSQSRVGLTMLGRPLPVGDTYRSLGGFIAIPRHLVNPMLDAIAAGDPDSLVEEIASMFRPPSLRNTAGEELAFHTLRWAIDDLDAATGALTAAGLERDDESGSWQLVGNTASQRKTILATLSLDRGAGVLTGEVNSDERADTLRDLVAAAISTSRLIDDERRELDGVDSDDDEQPALPDQNHPEIRQLLDEFMIAKEVEWIDEAIPALGGRTPRDAVTDPIGREQVVQLLGSWGDPPPGEPEPGGFRPSRIRALLGLEP